MQTYQTVHNDNQHSHQHADLSDVTHLEALQHSERLCLLSNFHMKFNSICKFYKCTHTTHNNVSRVQIDA